MLHNTLPPLALSADSVKASPLSVGNIVCARTRWGGGSRLLVGRDGASIEFGDVDVDRTPLKSDEDRTRLKSCDAGRASAPPLPTATPPVTATPPGVDAAAAAAPLLPLPLPLLTGVANAIPGRAFAAGPIDCIAALPMRLYRTASRAGLRTRRVNTASTASTGVADGVPMPLTAVPPPTCGRSADVDANAGVAGASA